MPGLIVDIDWLPAPRLSLEGELEAGHKVARWPDLTPRGAPEGVSAPPGAPRDGRGAVMGREDDLGGRDIAALLGEARALGYEEKPAPNGGVRKMRVLNFLRARRK